MKLFAKSVQKKGVNQLVLLNPERFEKINSLKWAAGLKASKDYLVVQIGDKVNVYEGEMQYKAVKAWAKQLKTDNVGEKEL